MLLRTSGIQERRRISNSAPRPDAWDSGSHVVTGCDGEIFRRRAHAQRRIRNTDIQSGEVIF
jgi:hypothetical protein